MSVYDAVVDNDLFLVQELVENGVDLHEDDEAALRHACRINNKEIIAYLLLHGADAEIDDGKCIEYAMENEDIETLQLILDYTENIDSYHLMRAASNGDTSIVKLLMYHGVNDFRIAMDSAIRNNNIETVETMLRGEIDIDGNLNRADPNDEYPNEDELFPPLHTAILLNREEIAKLLLDYGADKDTPVIREAIRMARILGYNDVLAVIDGINNSNPRNNMIENAREIEQKNEEKRREALREYKEASLNKKETWVDKQCTNNMTLFGDEIKEKDRDSIVIFFLENSDGKGECLTKEELLQIKQQRSVGLWEGPPSGVILDNNPPGRKVENSVIFKLPWLGVWVTEQAIEEGLKNINSFVILSHSEKNSIGSSFGVSQLHGQWGGHWGFQYINNEPHAVYVNSGDFQPDERYVVWDL